MNVGEIKRWAGFMAPNPSMLRLLLAQEGYEVNQWNNRAGVVYGWQALQEERVHWVLSGELEITVDFGGKYHRYTLKAGDRDLMSPNVFHQARAIGTEDLVYLIGIKRKVEEVKVEEIARNAKKSTTKAKKPITKKTKPKTTKAATKAKKSK